MRKVILHMADINIFTRKGVLYMDGIPIECGIVFTGDIFALIPPIHSMTALNKIILKNYDLKKYYIHG